jgi:hypothetical protein
MRCTTDLDQNALRNLRKGAIKNKKLFELDLQSHLELNVEASFFLFQRRVINFSNFGHSHDFLVTFSSWEKVTASKIVRKNQIKGKPLF